MELNKVKGKEDEIKRRGRGKEMKNLEKTGGDIEGEKILKIRKTIEERMKERKNEREGERKKIDEGELEKDKEKPQRFKGDYKKLFKKKIN